MNSSIKRVISTLKHVPGTRAIARHLSFLIVRHWPVESCPAKLARFLEIKVPHGVDAKASSGPDGSANIKIILDLLRSTTQIGGDVAECGVFRGASLVTMGLFVKQHSLNKKVLGFD